MKVFISGSISIKKLPQIAIDKLNRIMEQNLTVIVGDANGIDSLVQNYLADNSYLNVNIYHAGNYIRNNVANWPTISVPSMNLTGRALYTLKDKEMAKDADFGMMIWDGQSKGTKANITEMTKLGKHFYVIQGESIVSDKELISMPVSQQQELFAV